MSATEASRPRTDPAPAVTVGLEQAEAAIAGHYRRLVRLGYLVLPPSLGRHRRVLTAHGLVQRALPRAKEAAETLPPLPRQRGTDGPADDPGYAYVRLRVLRAALAAGQPVTVAGRPVRWLPRRRPLLPRVLGLRVFPQPGAGAEPALDQALSQLSATTRAAFVLGRLEGLPDESVRAWLTAAGVSQAHARAAVRSAAAVPLDAVPGGGVPVDGGGDGRDATGAAPLEDPCTLQARPTDLLRRRQYGKAAVAVAAALTVGAGLLVLVPGEDSPAFGGQAAREALNPALLERAEPDAWQSAARLDFSVWPARGPAADDAELLGRALAAWAAPDRSVRISTTPGTPTGPAAGPPRLLYAGEVAGAFLVVFHDGLRLVRYGEPAEGRGGAVLDFARTDGADATTAAMVLNRGAGEARYLTAPWVAQAQLHDLLAPGAEPVPLELDADGVTAAAPNALGAAECTTAPAVEFTGPATPDGGVVQADLGELVPASLTDGAPGEAAGHPLEGAAADRWARTACHLPSVGGEGVRAVNVWEFARQTLPGGAGTARWVCTRAVTWRGAGTRAMTQFQGPPSPGAAAVEPGAVTARAADGTACGERAPGVLTGARWRSPDGDWYLLAAGSPRVTAISAEGEVTGRAEGRTLVLPAPTEGETDLTADLTDGTTLPALR